MSSCFSEFQLLTFLLFQLFCDAEKNRHCFILAAVSKALFNVNIVICYTYVRKGFNCNADTGRLHVKCLV